MALRQISRALRVAADALEAEGARRLLRARRPGSLQEELAFVKTFAYGHVRPAPNQIDGEILTLLERVRELAPRVVVEIGRAAGGTLFMLTRVCPADCLIVSLDLGAAPRVHDRFFASFARDRQDLHVLRGNSHDPAVATRVRELTRAAVDFLFVDGDHSYAGVSADFDTYAPLVRPGGLVALHDIVPGLDDFVGGVPRFWTELKARRSDVEEIVESWDQGGFGIGLVPVAPERA